MRKAKVAPFHRRLAMLDSKPLREIKLGDDFSPQIFVNESILLLRGTL